MAAIDRHDLHQLLCIGLAQSAQYKRGDELIRLLRTLPGNGTQTAVTHWIERFSPYRVLLDDDRRPLSVVQDTRKNFDPVGAAATPFWRLPDEVSEPAGS